MPFVRSMRVSWRALLDEHERAFRCCSLHRRTILRQGRLDARDATASGDEARFGKTSRMTAERTHKADVFRKIWAIASKDLALERHSRETVSAMLIFSLIVILVFSFSFDMRVETPTAVAPGVLWVAFTFAGTLGLGRSFILERDQGCIDGLLLCPVDRSVIYVGKTLSNFILISLIEAITLPVYLALFNLPFRPLVLPVIVLGTLGFSGVGTLFSALTVHARAREAMLPVLLFPIVLPVLTAAVRLTGGVLDGRPWAEMSNWLQLLIGFDVIFLAVAYMVFDYVVEE